MRRIKIFNKIYETHEKYGSIGILLLIISILSIVIGLYILIEFLYKISDTVTIVKNGEKFDSALTGTIGDFVGGTIGTLWALSGVILFFLALRLQSKELNLQIKEMQNTKEVFLGQQFENTFFNLIKNQNEIRTNLKINTNKDNAPFTKDEFLYGVDAFDYLNEEIKNSYFHLQNDAKILERNNDKTNQQNFKINYEISFDNYSNQKNVASKIPVRIHILKYYNEFGHYFRHLYHILLFIKENEQREIDVHLHEEFLGKKTIIKINGEDLDVKRIKEKYRKYAQFLQAQMSNSELFLTFYNALFFEKSKRLIQYYNLIENLNLDDLLNPEIDERFYDEYYYEYEKIPKTYLKVKKELLKI